MERIRVVAEFENQAHTAGKNFGYDQQKLTRFVAVRGHIAEIAIAAYGIADVKEITEKLVEEIVQVASPEFQDKLSKHAAEHRRFKRIAEVDTLTGLGSRYAYQSARERAEEDDNVRFLLLDADNFGKINKELGHDAGHEALKGIAGHIKQTADKFGFGERTFRIGGDEFAVLARANVAEELRETIVDTYGENDNGIQQYGSTIVSLTCGLGDNEMEADQELILFKETKRA